MKIKRGLTMLIVAAAIGGGALLAAPAEAGAASSVSASSPGWHLVGKYNDIVQCYIRANWYMDNGARASECRGNQAPWELWVLTDE
ncbi:hypothetical protein [Nonomuraea aurantiaca]|uniref:hypothetical protein n=1 Tax=Nonomuraea aurantiaca TaxID=2878562 RepID=UPI001CDA1DB7|nr:hypothetical protein [Nonomuraea aurantiaca]MCA2230287.1 hypothetical protein [Nonomuraea aurantiaca]